MTIIIEAGRERENLLLASVAVLRVPIFTGTHSSKFSDPKKKTGNREVIKKLNIGVNRSWKRRILILCVFLGFAFSTTNKYCYYIKNLLFILIRIVN